MHAMDNGDFNSTFKVRAVTFFKQFQSLPKSDENWHSFVIAALSALKSIQNAIETLGIEVQMLRLATNIMEKLESGDGSLEDIIHMAVDFEQVAVDCGLPVLNLGTIRDKNLIRQSNGLSELMNQLQTSFVSVSWDDDTFGMSEALAISREIITMEKNKPGSNFRFGVLFNCKGGIPYFPAAFADETHSNGGIALGIENSHLLQYCYENAQKVYHQTDPVQDGSCPLKILEKEITTTFSRALRPLEEKVIEAAKKEQVNYVGIDTSIAPDLRGPNHNIEKCLTMMAPQGLPSTIHRPWMSGSASTIDAITRGLKSVDVKRCGYCGVMLPVLENESLAAAAERNDLTIQKLLLYSNMCGVGLDVLPVPGSGEEVQHRMAALLLDIAAISRRQKKPLSVRLLPVCDSLPGDKTRFDFNPYIINGTVMDF